MMKKKILRRGVSVVMVTASVMGMMGGGGGKKQEDVKADTEESTSIRFMDVSPSEARENYYKDTFQKFQEETGIEVIYESVPWDDAANKLTVLGTAGQLPDVLTFTESWFGQFTEAEWLYPLDEYVEEHEDEYNEVVKGYTWEQQRQLYGHVYAVPDAFQVSGIYYRKDWAKEIGYEIPTGDDWTWDAYLELIKALTDKEKNRYGNSFRGARGGFDCVQGYLQGITIGKMYDEEGNCLLNSPECVDAFAKWCDIYRDGYVPEDSVNWGFAEMVDNFASGLTGTLWNDSEVALTLSQKMSDDEWGVLPVPVCKDGTRIIRTSNPYSYVVSSQTKNKEAAIELIDFLSRTDNNMQYCLQTGAIPVKADVGDDENYGEDGIYAPFVAQLNQQDAIFPTNYGPFDVTDLHQETLHVEMQKCLLGEQTEQETLDILSNELSSRMKKHLEENPGSKVPEPIVIQ